MAQANGVTPIRNTTASVLTKSAAGSNDLVVVVVDIRGWPRRDEMCDGCTEKAMAVEWRSITTRSERMVR